MFVRRWGKMMNVEEKDLRERYANLSEYELADILRSADLTETAKKCLNDELRSRGLSNLDAEVNELNKIDEDLEKNLNEKIIKQKDSIKRFNKPFYISGTVFLLIGLALYLYSELNLSITGSGISGAKKEERLGTMSIALGCVLLIFVWVRTAAKLINIKIIYRK
jgi:hypothetical protein